MKKLMIINQKKVINQIKIKNKFINKIFNYK